MNFTRFFYGIRFRKLILFSIFFIFCFTIVNAQNYADRKKYLIDSVDLALLSTEENHILDSVLQVYKRSKHDTTKFLALSYFIEQCSNALVWVRYNDFILNKLENNLNQKIYPKSEISPIKKIIAGAFNNKGYHHGESGEIDLQIYYYNKGLSLRMQVGDKPGEAASLNNLGYAYKIKGDTKKAIQYYKQSAEVFSILNDTPGQALSRTNMGVLYENLGDIENAVNSFDESMKLYESMKDMKGVSHAYYNLGSLYMGQKDVKKAREYFWKSLNLRKKIDYLTGVGFCYSNIGQSYQVEKNQDSAIYYFNLGLGFLRGKNKLGEANCLANIGNAYLHLKQHNSAIPFLEAAEKLQDEISFKQGLSSTRINLARAFFMSGNYSKANVLAQTALQMSQELGYPNSIRDAAKLLYELAKEKGDFKTALFMNELFVTMRDSIANLENEKLTFRQQTKFEFEKAQAINDAKHDKELSILELKKNEQRVISLVSTFFLVVVLILTWIIYNRLKIVRSQKATIENQKIEVETAHLSLFEKNKEILDSINYAKRIQEAFLKKEINLNLNAKTDYIPEHFVLFKPKDIVSGDFFWKYHSGDYLYLAAADCTGHGVPGALLTMIGTSFLNEILSSEFIYSPSEILNILRERIIMELNQGGKNAETKDGMDISLVRIRLGGSTSCEIMWAGANNPIYISSERELASTYSFIKKELSGNKLNLFSIHPDKMPIGYFEQKTEFSNYEFQLNKGEHFYLFTDGYADQFGGPKGKKYKYSTLKEKLNSIASLSVSEQLKSMEIEFETWKGNLEQVDDVCLIGVTV